MEYCCWGEGRAGERCGGDEGTSGSGVGCGVKEPVLVLMVDSVLMG